MTDSVVDVAAITFSRNPKDILRTPTLGGCVCVSLYDKEARGGGLVISPLPDSGAVGSVAAENHPLMYIDLAIPYLLEQALENGIQPSVCSIVLAGGGHICKQAGAFDIGRQNGHKALEILDHYGLKPAHQSLGGKLNRSLTLEIRTGTVRITYADKEIAVL